MGEGGTRSCVISGEEHKYWGGYTKIWGGSDMQQLGETGTVGRSSGRGGGVGAQHRDPIPIIVRLLNPPIDSPLSLLNQQGRSKLSLFVPLSIECMRNTSAPPPF